MKNLNKKIKVCHSASVDMTIKFLLLDRLKFLLSQGYDVYATCSPGKWVKDIEGDGIKVKTIGFKRKPFSPVSDLVSFSRLFFYFKKEKFHIVHTHTLKPEFYGQIAAKLAGVPIIINTLHGFDFTEEDSFLKKKIIILLQKIAAYCSDVIFVIAQHIIDGIKKEKITDENKIRYLGRDIDTERFNPGRFDKNFIARKKLELGIKESAKIIGIVARLVKEKGYVELFEAFKNIILKFPDTVLLVVGPLEPEKNDSIKPEFVKGFGIEKSVFFVGDQKKIEEFYAIMDIFVLPTHREGLGAATLEASSMEKPVVVSNIGGCPETVDDKKTGFLVPVRDAKKLEEAMIFLLENKTAADAIGKAGRKKVLKQFKKEIVFERLAKDYQEIISKKLI